MFFFAGPQNPADEKPSEEEKKDKNAKNKVSQWVWAKKKISLNAIVLKVISEDNKEQATIKYIFEDCKSLVEDCFS